MRHQPLMVFLNDGAVGTLGSLLSGGQDSFGKPLKFKLNAETGTYEAQGSDRKIYYIDTMAGPARVSVAQMPSDAYVEAVREASDDPDAEVRPSKDLPSAPAATLDDVMQKDAYGDSKFNRIQVKPQKAEDVKAEIEKADSEYKSKSKQEGSETKSQQTQQQRTQTTTTTQTRR